MGPGPQVCPLWVYRCGHTVDTSWTFPEEEPIGQEYYGECNAPSAYLAMDLKTFCPQELRMVWMAHWNPCSSYPPPTPLRCYGCEGALWQQVCLIRFTTPTPRNTQGVCPEGQGLFTLCLAVTFHLSAKHWESKTDTAPAFLSMSTIYWLAC